jgi:hypothetical protein
MLGGTNTGYVLRSISCKLANDQVQLLFARPHHHNTAFEHQADPARTEGGQAGSGVYGRVGGRFRYVKSGAYLWKWHS